MKHVPLFSAAKDAIFGQARAVDIQSAAPRPHGGGMLPPDDAHAEPAERELPFAEGVFGRGFGRLFPVKTDFAVLAAGDDALRQIDRPAVFPLRDIAEIEQVLQRIVLFYPEMPSDSANIIPNILLGNEYMGYAMLGFICVLVLSASMSTLSSLALVSSSSLGVDVYKGYIKKDASDKQVALLVRILCFLFVVVSALLAIFQIDAIVTLMSLSWGTLAGCFMGPYIYGLYTKKANKHGAYISVTMCLVTTIVLIFVFGALAGGKTFGELVSLGIKRSPMIGVFCMAQSMIVTPIGMLFKTGKKNDAVETPAHEETLVAEGESAEA